MPLPKTSATRCQWVRFGTRHFKMVAPGVWLAVLLSGCAVGPDYQPPTATLAPTWQEYADPRLTNAPPTEPKWWATAFQDPDLDWLVQTALEENLTLRSAGVRVLQAQQRLAIAIGSQFPQQQQVTGSASRQKSDGKTFNNYSVGLNVGWEIDLWGRFRRQAESASAQLDASVANYDGVLVSLVSQVAQTYVLIRTYQDRMEVIRRNIQAQEESLRIAQVKFEFGETSPLDMVQAESLLENTRATVSSLEISLQQFKNSLAILLGRPPQMFNGLLRDKKDIPSVLAEVALGMPQDLIRRRPDIRVAERQLAAQSAQIGFAVTELFPHLTIGGSVVTAALTPSGLFAGDSTNWELFGVFEWNILNYGRLRNNVRLQDALFQQLLVDYRQAVLLAQGDVEDSIVAYLKTHEQLTSYERSAEAAEQALIIASVQYREGALNFNTVITILQAHLQQQDLLSSTRGNAAVNLVQVYKSLGGGWEIRENRDPVDLLPDATKKEMQDRTGIWNRTFGKNSNE